VHSRGPLQFKADGRLLDGVVDERVVERDELSGDHLDHFLSRDAADQRRHGRDLTRTVVTPSHTHTHTLHNTAPLYLLDKQAVFTSKIEGLRERTEYIDIFLFLCPSLNRVLFSMFCLLVEGECQILVF